MVLLSRREVWKSSGRVDTASPTLLCLQTRKPHAGHLLAFPQTYRSTLLGKGGAHKGHLAALASWREPCREGPEPGPATFSGVPGASQPPSILDTPPETSVTHLRDEWLDEQVMHT